MIQTETLFTKKGADSGMECTRCMLPKMAGDRVRSS